MNPEKIRIFPSSSIDVKIPNTYIYVTYDIISGYIASLFNPVVFIESSGDKTNLYSIPFHVASSNKNIDLLVHFLLSNESAIQAQVIDRRKVCLDDARAQGIKDVAQKQLALAEAEAQLASETAKQQKLQIHLLEIREGAARFDASRAWKEFADLNSQIEESKRVAKAAGEKIAFLTSQREEVAAEWEAEAAKRGEETRRMSRKLKAQARQLEKQKRQLKKLKALKKQVKAKYRANKEEGEKLYYRLRDARMNGTDLSEFETLEEDGEDLDYKPKRPKHIEEDYESISSRQVKDLKKELVELEKQLMEEPMSADAQKQQAEAQVTSVNTLLGKRERGRGVGEQFLTRKIKKRKQKITQRAKLKLKPKPNKT